MQHSKRVTLVRLLFSLALAFAILLLFQIAYAQELSFGNDVVDHFMHFGSSFVAFLVLLLLLFALLMLAKKNWHRATLILSIVPAGIGFLLSTLFLPYIVFASAQSNARYYFHEDNGYQYYIVSERFVAFEGSRELRYYKEKPILLFMKQRLLVTEDEMRQKGIDPIEPAQKLWELHGR